MYGWRGRIAIIVGKRNAVCEPEFNKMAPTGVSVHAARTGSYTTAVDPSETREKIEEVAIYHDPEVMERVEKTASRLSSNLSGLQPSVVVFTHHAASMASVEFNRRLTETMASRAGCPALTAGSAVVQALRAVGAEKIGLADPFPKPFLTQIVRDHLQHPEVGLQGGQGSNGPRRQSSCHHQHVPLSGLPDRQRSRSPGGGHDSAVGQCVAHAGDHRTPGTGSGEAGDRSQSSHHVGDLEADRRGTAAPLWIAVWLQLTISLPGRESPVPTRFNGDSLFSPFLTQEEVVVDPPDPDCYIEPIRYR